MNQMHQPTDARTFPWAAALLMAIAGLIGSAVVYHAAASPSWTVATSTCGEEDPDDGGGGGQADNMGNEILFKA